MKISTRGRYALAAVTVMAKCYNSGESITVIRLSEKLGLSKIYLEQVFALLKRGRIVNSIKGSQGGYILARAPYLIVIYDVLLAVETSLFEETEETVLQKAPEIDAALRDVVFIPLDQSVKEMLQQVSVFDLAVELERYQPSVEYEFSI